MRLRRSHSRSAELARRASSAAASARAPFKPDPRPARVFRRFHRHTSSKAPILQTICVAAAAPIITVLARVQIEGRERIPAGGGFIVASNHPSVLDPIFVALAFRRRIRFMGKSDVFRGVMGWVASRLGAFPVRRGVWDTDAFETAESVIRRGRVLAIFPEGGCSASDGALRSARPGIGYVAQRAGAYVVPVWIEGARKMYRPWTFPRVRVRIGEPVLIEENPEPTREANQRVAEQILAQIKELGP